MSNFLSLISFQIHPKDLMPHAPKKKLCKDEKLLVYFYQIMRDPTGKDNKAIEFREVCRI